jgi:hypothetical protein
MPITVPTPTEYAHMNERQKFQAQRNLKAIAAMLKLPQFAAIDFVVRNAEAWRHIYGVHPDAETNLRVAVDAVHGAQHG